MNKLKKKLAQYPDSGKPKQVGVPEKYKSSWVDSLKGQFTDAELPMYKTLYTQQLKDNIANAEVSGEKDKYKAVNPDTKAVGKYQFLPSTLKGYGITDIEAFKNNPKAQEDLMNKHSDYLFNRAATLSKLHGLQLGDNLLNLASGVHFKGNDGLYDELTGKSSLSKSTNINPSTNEYINRTKMKLGGKLKKYDDGGQGLTNYLAENVTKASSTNPTKLLSGTSIPYAELGQLAGTASDALIPDKEVNGQSFKTKGDSILSNTLKGAGIGAGIEAGAVGAGLIASPTLAAGIGVGAGAAAGAAAGSVVPVIGTAVGAIGGAITGAVIAGREKDKYRNALSDFTAQNHKALINSYSQPDYGTSLPGFATGGQMDKLNNSDLIQYSAKSHSLGGQDINAGGIPVTDNSGKAEIEKDENNHNGYIYSATLGVDKEGNPTANAKEVKTTYSKLAKKINSKYGNREDNLAKTTKEFEYNNLKAKNDESIKMKEEVDIKKANSAISRVMKKWGGTLNKYPNGGEIPGLPYWMQPQQPAGVDSTYWKKPFYNGLPNTMTPNTSVPPLTTWGVGVPGLNNAPQGNGFDPYAPNMPQGANPDSIQGNQPIPPPPYQYPQPTDKEYKDRELYDAIAQGNIWNGGVPNPNQSTSGKDDYPYVQGYEYNKQPGWGTNPQVTPPIPNQVMFGQEPKSSKTEVPTTGNNIDYAGLGLSTIAPLINFAYGTVKDNNKYYPNQGEGRARNELSQLPTDYNIDANLAQNSRDTNAAQRAADNRNANTGNAVGSQLLTNKLYANNQLYGTKANAETQMKSDKLKTLSNFDYTSGENNRGQKIALEDKNLANKARREDLQLNAINTLSSNLNTKRNESAIMKNLPLVLKYTKVDANGNMTIDKDKVTSASKEELVILNQLLGNNYDSKTVTTKSGNTTTQTKTN